ncbi:hypothetical protein ACFPER_02205 [Agromyces aurantiacus]|uniref:Lipoprotein n=1 Tax=Agromyces aurantiacus TaxID=165814 RepID=A0ABV9R0H5_9MICO|nr:hypothetical protein [Agromyces aurantiacus]MBM7505900.1 hypothetical protein [Agromyces aurantiacus]
MSPHLITGVGPIGSAAITATAVAILLVGCAPPTAGSNAEPAAAVVGAESPTSTTSDCPNPYGGTCLGALEAGEYQTSTFEPQITYRVPEGWMNYEDLPGNFWLFLQEDEEFQATPRGGSYLGIFTGIHAAAIDCSETWQEGVGTNPAQLVAWYQSVPGLIVSEPVKVSVGGLRGLQIDVSLEEGNDTCNFGGYTGIPLITGDGVSEVHHVVLDDMDVRLVFLRHRNSNVTLEITNVREQRSAEEFRGLVQPIVDSLAFATPSVVSCQFRGSPGLAVATNVGARC